MPSAVGDRLARAGVLGLQGDFREHIDTFERLGTSAIDALIIPGGESTTIGKLAEHYGFIPKLRERIAAGMAVWGTCAGAIFLARDVPGHPHPILGAMDLTVRRNAFGRQRESFEADLDVPRLGAAPFHAVFIRSPLIARVGDGVEVLSTLPGGAIVAVRQDRLLATSFHPELTRDDRFHAYFLALGAGG